MKAPATAHHCMNKLHEQVLCFEGVAGLYLCITNLDNFAVSAVSVVGLALLGVKAYAGIGMTEVLVLYI